MDLNSSLEELFPKSKPQYFHKLSAANIETIKDLLWILPTKAYKTPLTSPFDQAIEGRVFKGEGKLVSVSSRPNFYQKRRSRSLLVNISGSISDRFSKEVIHFKWFNSYSSTTKKLEELKEKDWISFIGTISIYNNQIQIINPQILGDGESQKIPDIIKDYPVVGGVSGKQIEKVINKLSDKFWDNLYDPVPTKILEERNFFSLGISLRILHGKYDSENYDEVLIRARERLIYDEFLTEQAYLSLIKNENSKCISPQIKTSEASLKQLRGLLPFELTQDQKSCLTDISGDLSHDFPMRRLIQGDVGCGKTSVALISSAIVAKNNFQVALMCPTESLAIQHFKEFSSIFEKSSLNISLLIGSINNKYRKNILLDLEIGKTDIIIGTHALIQDKVIFHKLGLVIIDEQHKFGVNQRNLLLKKSLNCHFLAMTATPIPRSLSLTQYGDMDISSIKEFPKSKKEIKTRVVTEDNFEKFLSFVKTRMSMNEQAYFVVPSITESENFSTDLNHLEKVLGKFKSLFPELIIEPIHGQLDPDTKNTTFQKFTENKINILVSTTVIEVGINVPNATIVAIFNPERFGLSSLHQLRGRVGRGSKPGFCFLIKDQELNKDSLSRLKVIENCSDGFLIAEEDLKLRGEGDLIGTNQSGFKTSKRMANICLHQDLLLKARKDLEDLISAQKWPLIQELARQNINSQNFAID